MDIAETRTFGVLSIGLTVGFIAFLGWLFRPPPRCDGEILFAQTVFPCRHWAGHAGRCEPDWLVR